MVWLYPKVKKKFEDMTIRFDRIHERDGRIDGQTQHDGIGRAYASRGKNAEERIRLNTVEASAISISRVV